MSRSSLAKWQVTDHARQRMGERAIAASELVELLSGGATIVSAREGEPHLMIYSGGGIRAVIDESTWTVITVLIDGGTKTNWQSVMMERAQAGVTPKRSVEELLEMFEPPRVKKAAAARRKLARSRTSAVQTTHVLDTLVDARGRSVSPSLRRLIEQVAQDPAVLRAGGYATVRILGPGRVEFDVA